MHKLFMIVLIAAMASTPALADIVAIGGPMPSGSWWQRFEESGVGPFTEMEIYMTGFGTFKTTEGNGFTDFSSLGWTGLLPLDLDGRHAVASGLELEWLQFNIHFSPDLSVPLSFDFMAWNGNTRVEAAHAEWNGYGNWTITAVPEGFTWPLMSASSLIAVVGLARRRAKGC